jgi:ATP-dependent Lhr-like helicase
VSFYGFHPLIEEWFTSRFDAPTDPQQQGWPSIADGHHVLIAAPTGSGKTLTAFLACIDRLLKRALAGPLDDEMSVVYVSPLRALSNDMHRNLEEPLQEIREIAAAQGIDLPKIRVGLRTGDTSSSARQSMVRRPPHIFVTTPESLYLMLTSQKGRAALQTVETLIVDEIHALVRDKRGSHLSLSMERLEALIGRPLQRIGLSATQRPIEQVARFLVGNRDDVRIVGAQQPVVSEQPGCSSPNPTADGSGHSIRTPAVCQIVDVGHSRELDLAIEVPPSELGAVCMHEQWDEVNERVVELIKQHRSTLIFVNTRRMAERVTHQLTELLGEDAVGAHHGSLAAEIRLTTERRLKSGDLKAVVATASLELGIDIGYIDLVIQLGSPGSIAAFVQRIGRSGHSLGLIPKGRIFAMTRDELLEAMSLMRAVSSGRLDKSRIPQAPLDILAQHIVAEVCGQDWHVDELFELFCRADPFRDLSRREFDRTVDYLSEGIARQNGRGRVYLHFDRVGRRLKARKGARITATSNGGAIPETGQFRVVTEPEGITVGTLDEEFAIESNRGDIFLLGNTSWRILHLRGGQLTVADAHGAPPTIPFWQGEAPGRTLELSEEVSLLREELEERIVDPPAATHWLQEETHCSEFAARQAVDYAMAQKAAVGLLPTQKRIVFERFFDETGGMQLVVHAPFGAAINRAWGFSMRKRFCVSFDFELQATADDNGFILSLGPQHSFPIETLFPMLTQHNARNLLEQAALTNPVFQIRWRWNVTRALQVDRMRNGKRVPPNLQRFRSDDLLTAVFPALTGCQEEHTGDHILPDHPLALQTMEDCLNENMNLDGLLEILAQVEAGEITFVARDTREPSPFSYELLNSNPYTFLDGGEVQERRARAIGTRRSLTVESVSDLGRLDPNAIEQVRREAKPHVRDADELHDLLLGRFVIWTDEIEPGWERWFDELSVAQRATTIVRSDAVAGWVSAERLPAVEIVYPMADLQPKINVPAGVKTDWTTVAARCALIRGLVEICGPITTGQLADRLLLTMSQTFASLEALEGEGVVLRGRFELDLQPADAHSAGFDDSGSRPDPSITEWCHRRLLARIHRLTMQGLRKQIEPVGVDTFFRFLTRQHGLLAGHQKQDANGVFETVAQLQGVECSAIAWEHSILQSRVAGYERRWLDDLCLSGEIGWGRLFPVTKNDAESGNGKPSGVSKVVPVSFFLRSDRSWLSTMSGTVGDEGLSALATKVIELLQQSGAMFAADLATDLQMSAARVDAALGELVRRGLVTADSLAGLRSLIGDRATDQQTPQLKSKLLRQRRPAGGTGRWSVWRRQASQAVVETSGSHLEQSPANEPTADEQWAWQLLRRWGVVFRDMLLRETGAPNWFNLLQVYRRLEARGEIRGGRFISGVAGEQFAAGDTVKQLRELRDSPTQHELVVISAADPLNLVGILTPGSRVPALAGNRIAWLDGRPVAATQGGRVLRFVQISDAMVDEIAEKLGVEPLEVLAGLHEPTQAEESTPQDTVNAAQPA